LKVSSTQTLKKKKKTRRAKQKLVSFSGLFPRSQFLKTVLTQPWAGPPGFIGHEVIK